MKYSTLALAIIALTGCTLPTSMPNDGLHLLEKEIPQSLEETAIKLQLYNKRCNESIKLEFYANDKTLAFNPGLGGMTTTRPIEFAESEDGKSTMVYWYWNNSETDFQYFTHGLTNPDRCAEDYSFTERVFTGVGES